MAHLTILSGRLAGKKLVVSESGIIVGRDEDCHVRLASTEVSRKHCVFTATPEGILLRDMKSSNGTYVNDQPIMGEVLLEPGDVVRIATSEFEVPGAKRQVVDQKLDDDVASWLSEDTKAPGSAGDTTIIQDSIFQSNLKLEKSKPAPKKEFKSVAEEARDIIQRHLELQNQQAHEQP